MRVRRLGCAVLAVGAMAALAPPAEATTAQRAPLRATISPQVVEPTGVPVAESVDPCFIAASAPLIEVIVKDPHGAVISHQGYWRATPPGVFDDDRQWSIEIRMLDESGQPTGEPFPEPGPYTVQVNCVSTYAPVVVKPYEELRFEVVDRLPAPTTTSTTAPESTSTTTAGTATVPTAPPAVPVVAEPNFTG